MKLSAIAILGALTIMSLFGCSSTRPTTIGVADNQLSPCPSRPNCVSSDASDADHRIEPLRFQGDPAETWEALKAVVAAQPRMQIIASDDRYLHAEASSRIFGFVDDVEFHLRPEQSMIAVRSASRIGYSDMGVNAERVETIRKLLSESGAVR